ncbi:helix-turn-helix transcriptional regulator [Carnobacterium maltaromaticum]|uniref:helix-turn-helix transcriptional regulator n=1 Tax=Carnobacterium maltaromaticum TaxID=2751 RepID=UPI00295EA5B2|nr:helix-turn-helix transcriptional regulator [Carnobacterium maltaromaticum]
MKISAVVVTEEFDVSQPTISRYEKGEIEKLPTNIDDIVTMLNTTLAYLMCWTDKDLNSLYNKLIDVEKLKYTTTINKN